MTRGKVLRWLLVLGVLGALVVGGVTFGPTLRGAPEEKTTPSGPADVSVTVAPLTVRPVGRSVAVVGTLEGFEEVNIAAKVDGRVTRLQHDIGDIVKPGELLAELDDTDYRLALAESQRGMELELARLGLKEMPKTKVDISRLPLVMRSKNVEDNARSILERLRKLGARNVSLEERDKAEMEARVAGANRQQAELDALSTLAAARQKQAQVESARQKIDDCKVRVPTPSPARLPPGIKDPSSIRYVVAGRKVAEGEMMRAMQSTILYRLVIDQPLKLVVTVPERFVGEVKIDQPVTLNIEAYPGQTFQGKVTRLNPTVDRNNRTFTVEVTVPNKERKLRAGSFAKAGIQTRAADRAWTVPEEAIVRFAGVVKVFVVENNKTRAVPVVVGETVNVAEGTRQRRWVEVTGDLPNGARVVTSGQSMLAEGTAVRVR